MRLATSAIAPTQSGVGDSSDWLESPALVSGSGEDDGMLARQDPTFWTGPSIVLLSIHSTPCRSWWFPTDRWWLLRDLRRSLSRLLRRRA